MLSKLYMLSHIIIFDISRNKTIAKTLKSCAVLNLEFLQKHTYQRQNTSFLLNYWWNTCVYFEYFWCHRLNQLNNFLSWDFISNAKEIYRQLDAIYIFDLPISVAAKFWTSCVQMVFHKVGANLLLTWYELTIIGCCRDHDNKAAECILNCSVCIFHGTFGDFHFHSTDK